MTIKKKKKHGVRLLNFGSRVGVKGAGFRLVKIQVLAYAIRSTSQLLSYSRRLWARFIMDRLKWH